MKKTRKRRIVTEKFALLNLLKAIGSLSPGAENTTEPVANEEHSQQRQNQSPYSAQNSSSQTEQRTYPNVMASVLERHEAISNRVKNNHR